MEGNFLYKVEKSYIKGQNANIHFKPAIDFVRETAREADEKMRESKKEREIDI